MKRFLCILALTLALTFAQAQSIEQTSEWEPELTEFWEPQPEVITPGDGTAPPSDAIVLFDGSGLSEWVSAKDGSDAKWEVSDGAVTVVKTSGGIKTKKSFGDVQLHIEWRAPAEVVGESQGRGNSGIYFMEQYEVQVLDNYNNRTYINGQAGSTYKQTPPLVNACRPPGVWQTYDIVFESPVFREDGKLIKPAYVTVLHNGVLVQNHTEYRGPTVYRGLPYYKAHGQMPIFLQDHSNPVSYRNIWIREL